MKKHLVFHLCVYTLICFNVIMPQAFAKQNNVAAGNSCAKFGEFKNGFSCVKFKQKLLWKKITLIDSTKKYPTEGTPCDLPGYRVLGFNIVKNLDELNCIKTNQIVDAKNFWVSKSAITFGKAQLNSSNKILADAWKSIFMMPQAKSKIEVIYHIEPGANQEVVQYYKTQQERFLEKFGDYFNSSLPFHTVISISLEFLEKTNKEIDSSISGYSNWFSYRYAENKFNEALRNRTFGYPYASKKEMCADSINSNYRNPCSKLNGYVSGILLYPNYQAFGGEITNPSHELFELVQMNINENIFDWPAWLRSGGPAFISSALISNTEILNLFGGVLNAVPDVKMNQDFFDFNLVESDHQNQDKYSMGRYANGYLIGKYGIDNYMKFLANISSGNNWENELEKLTNLKKADFYSQLNKFIFERNKSRF